MNIQLNEILTKNDDQITDEDRELIKGNKDYLNADEQTRFKDLWPEEKPADAAAAPDAEGSIPKAELDTYLEAKRKEWEAQGNTKKEIEAKADKVEEFLKKNGEPKNWNETFKLMTKYYQENPDEIAPAIKKNFDSMTETEQKEVQNIHQKWEQNYDTLAKKDGLPLSTTKEGKDALSAIGALMTKYNNYDISAMYELARLLPKTAGGLADVAGDGTTTTRKTEEKPEDKKSEVKVNPNKKAASLIGGGSGGDKPKAPVITYDKLRAKSMSQIGEEMLKNS